MKQNEQNRGCLWKLLAILGASSLANLLTDKLTIRAAKGTIRAGEETIRAGQDFWCHLILWTTSFKRQKYYQIESKFNCVYSRNNLPKLKDGA